MQRIRPPIHQYITACLSWCCAEAGNLEALEGVAPFCEGLHVLLLGVVTLIPSVHWPQCGGEQLRITTSASHHLYVVTQVADGEGREAVGSGFSVRAGNIWHLPAARK